MGLIFSTPIRDTVICRRLGHGYVAASATAQGYRRAYEDRVVMQFDDRCFVGVFDGYSSSEVVEHCVQNLPAILLNCSHSDDLLKSACIEFDKNMPLGLEGGSTCVFAIFDHVSLGNVTIVNVGDSRASLYRNGEVLLRTTDHRPSDENERARVEEAGQTINNVNGVARVNGGLSMTRIFGDRHVKKRSNFAIIAEPDIYHWKMQKGDVLMLASDGLYEGKHVPSMAGFDAADIGLFCKDLVQDAITSVSEDNVSVALVTFSEQYTTGLTCGMPDELCALTSIDNAIADERDMIAKAKADFAKLHRF